MIFFILLTFSAVGQSWYRSKATGNWNALATWESAPAAGGPWSAAIATPTSADYSITIQSPHVVTITAAVSLDEVTINLGAILAATGVITITVNNGVGVDLINNGTFTDNLSGAGNITFSAGSKWSMSSGATLLKTSGSASNTWQSNYNGGIATIPSNANWILRKIAGANPALSTTTPASGSVYPNLIFENNTGAQWVTTTATGSFTGFAAFPTVKGNLDIGGSGSNTVSFLNEQTNAAATLVQGNVIVRSGNILRNFGTGLEIQGQLTVDGTISYDAADARKLIFSGPNVQTINGTGTIAIYDMRMIKTANDRTLNRAITIDNQLDLSWGKINSTLINIPTIIDVATVINTNNNSFVTGPVRKNGDNAFVFPVGKNNDYQAIGMSSGGGGGTVIFWTEDFGTGCTQNTTANGYTGGNGTWTQTSGANGSSANAWFVSSTEAGMGTANCGDGCINTVSLSNRTMHIANVAGSPLSAFFCPSGDCGAAYDAGFATGAVLTDKRMDSPLINCTGRVNINVSFNYIEGGLGTTDNAVLWYFDGAVWSNIYDMPKTAVCPLGQGLWTYTTITLPASANNNPNVKIGFRWVNNDDGAGGDPSFAVDDIQLSVSPSDVYTAEYFRGNPRTIFGTAKDPSLVSISGCEYWQLDRNVGGSSRIVSLDWDLNSCGITNVGNLRVARWEIPGALWKDEGNGGACCALSAGTIPSGNFIATYGTFTLSAIDGQPLPMELLTFNAVYNGSTVDVKWTTASEINNNFFTVERSENAIDFIPIGKVNGAGNSNVLLDYYYNDKQPLKGFSYYRLRQTDFDGKSAISQIVKINIASNSSFSIYSDALMQQITIQTVNEEHSGKIEIIDALGKVVKSVNLNGLSPFIISTANLSNGIYYARLTYSHGVSVVKFVY